MKSGCFARLTSAQSIN